MYSFDVSKWSAWAPSLSSEQDWMRYLAGEQAVDLSATPTLDFLEAIKRRRLSTISKAVLSVVHDVAQHVHSLPSVYCSVYGEAQKTYKILEMVAMQEEMSPTLFSVSVHNAIAGQSSVCFVNRAPSITVCPSEHNYLSAFVDAQVLAKENSDGALLVFFEDILPNFYKRYINSIENLNFPCAIALHVRTDSAQCPYSLSYQDVEGVGYQQQPFMLGLIALLLAKQRVLKNASYDLTLLLVLKCSRITSVNFVYTPYL